MDEVESLTAARKNSAGVVNMDSLKQAVGKQSVNKTIMWIFQNQPKASNKKLSGVSES